MFSCARASVHQDHPTGLAAVEMHQELGHPASANSSKDVQWLKPTGDSISPCCHPDPPSPRDQPISQIFAADSRVVASLDEDKAGLTVSWTGLARAFSV